MNKKLFQQYDLNCRPPTEQKIGYITQKNETIKTLGRNATRSELLVAIYLHLFY